MQQQLETPLPQCTSSPFKIKLSPLYQMVTSKQSRGQQGLTLDSLLYSSKLRARDQPILRQPRKTKPIVWFAAILCMIFTLLIIFFGVAVLIIFLAVQPKTPVFDTPAASLAAIYFNFSPPQQLIGNDMTFLANFSNPNRKLGIKYEHLYFELHFEDRLVAAQAIPPFSQKPGEVKLVSVHLLSSLTNAPTTLALELQRQGKRNRVVYQIKGIFRVRVNLGSVHYSYWLHGECQLEMTSPPNGVLIAHSCKTKR